jgi:glutaredoxin
MTRLFPLLCAAALWAAAILPAAAAPDEGAGSPEFDRHVRLYGTQWCGYCRRARELLNSRNIPFDDIDIDASPRGREQFALLGGEGVPLILVGRQRMDGYDKTRLEAMLREAGWQ